MSRSNEIDGVLDAVRIAWQRHPHLRLGQLIANASQFVPDPTDRRSVFYLEDKDLVDRLAPYLGDGFLLHDPVAQLRAYLETLPNWQGELPEGLVERLNALLGDD